MELKQKLNYTATLVALTIGALFCAFYGVISGITGFLMLPIVSAILGALFVFDKKKIFSIIISVLIIATDVLLGALLVSTFSILSALIISYAFKKGFKKGECAVALTAIMILMFVALIFIAAFLIAGAYTREAIISFYSAEYQKIIAVSTEQIMTMKQTGQLAAYGDLITEEYVAEIFNSFSKLLISMIVAASFIFAGATLKIFSAFIFKLSENTEKIKSWRFIPSALFGYFYLIITLISTFMGSMESVMQISIKNLELIFSVVFLYIGITFILGALVHKNKKPILGAVLIFVGFFTVPSLVITGLSITGAFVVIVHSKINHIGKFIFNSEDQSNKKE